MRLREALAGSLGSPETRGMDRILAESFWRPSPPARPAQVLALPRRRI